MPVNATWLTGVHRQSLSSSASSLPGSGTNGWARRSPHRYRSGNVSRTRLSWRLGDTSAVCPDSFSDASVPGEGGGAGHRAVEGQQLVAGALADDAGMQPLADHRATQ